MAFVAAFETSCAALAQLPADGIPEVALLGRSNVGKSSLLNTLAGCRDLARASRTPGRTRLLNLFLVNAGRLRLVDCPGYGYARAARSERAAWGALVDSYLTERVPLHLVVLLVDAGLDPQPLDLEMAAWLRARGRKLQLVATKWDRISGNLRPLARRRLQAAFAVPPLPFSSLTGEGRSPLHHLLLL
ncbi:MAG: ribosome biogenesis GTP-binding protein YihA/YsxC [Terriglobales bacterium]